MISVLILRAFAECNTFSGHATRISESSCVEVVNSFFDDLGNGIFDNPYGGAIRCSSTSSSSISTSTFRKCKVTAMLSDTYGGALSIEGPLTLTYCCFDRMQQPCLWKLY
jgi:hypothetical protein